MTTDGPNPADTGIAGSDRTRGPHAAPVARVRMYVRANCHLCDVAERIAGEVCARTGDQLELVDIDTDPALREQYTDQVPVTLVDGRQHDFWRVDPDRLHAALTGPGTEAPVPRSGRT